jgi:hypothetical protein
LEEEQLSAVAVGRASALPGKEVNPSMPKTSIANLSGDIGKWLTLASALAGVGILPKRWQKVLSAASAVVVIIKIAK